MRNWLALVFCFGCLFVGCRSTPSAKTTGIVIVGMENSAKYGKCEGSGVDANVMAEILSKYGNPTVLINNKATKANVLNALNAAKQNDLLIFYYSGHGGSDRIGNVSEEPDGKNEYLCLYDTYLLDNEIWNIVCSAKDRVFLIFDCCHSETMFKIPGIDVRGFFSRDGSAVPRLMLGNVKMLCWSGCPDNSYSYGDKTGGLLTKALKKAYRKNKSYDYVWNNIVFEMPNYQIPRKTEIGNGFNGKIFR